MTDFQALVAAVNELTVAINTLLPEIETMKLNTTNPGEVAALRDQITQLTQKIKAAT